MIDPFYQAFRWWGIGTEALPLPADEPFYQAFRWWGIGTSADLRSGFDPFYQAFRWWGIGTQFGIVVYLFLYLIWLIYHSLREWTEIADIKKASHF